MDHPDTIGLDFQSPPHYAVVCQFRSVQKFEGSLIKLYYTTLAIQVQVKFLESHTIQKHSLSTTEYLRCVGESFLLAKAKGKNVAFLSWSNIAPSPVPDASVRKIKGLSMSGNFSVGSLHT